ncbi:hypothetical protein PCASD_07204 [Puccinia coronata f. sp. avenae]|uniref:Uncharacterized protein n=1 Tax=Puccinia coronata f. sp. avenae TaxID=200324 RepID=A0A2N5UUJ1_9BASI|nr:hypothetical protein PCASD_07204 [Puccinia coronata f. sp. avenae]
MADTTQKGLEDSVIIQQQQEQIAFLEEQMEQNRKAEAAKEKEHEKKLDEWLTKRMEEMVTEIMNSRAEATPQSIPIPETPQPHKKFSVPPTGPTPGQTRFATSTPYTAAYGRGNPETPHPQNIYGASPAETRFGRVGEIKLPEEGEFKGFLDAKKANITFDGTYVEGFIKQLERIAMIQQCGSQNLACQLSFILNNGKISRAIELMEGHETGDWELLKKSLLQKWGRATPLRQYREENMTQLIQKAINNQGIRTNAQYKKFISEFEEMMDYFTQMEYSNLNPENGEPLWKALSAELKKEVTKELYHARKLKKTKDGRNIIPNLSTLKI